MSHTPGPWNFHSYYKPFPGEVHRVEGDSGFDYLAVSIAKGEMRIAEVLWDNSTNGGLPVADTVEEARANASLIVAAPQMLEALKEIYDWADNHEDVDDGIPNDANLVKGMIIRHLGDNMKQLEARR